MEMVRNLQARPDVGIVPQTDARFRAAVERYAARPGQTWSLTDCPSFLGMEERNITGALAYDRDFGQACFAALLRLAGREPAHDRPGGVSTRHPRPRCHQRVN